MGLIFFLNKNDFSLLLFFRKAKNEVKSIFFLFFPGARCENYINRCDSNPCANNASCITDFSTKDGYTCKCPANYTGISRFIIPSYFLNLPG